MDPQNVQRSLASRLESVATTNARLTLEAHGVRRIVMQGLRPIAAVKGPLAGPARTLRYMPAREDVPEPPRGSLNRWLADNIDKGEVMVCDALGCPDGAVLGDMLATRARHRGAVGAIVDGVVRDVEGLEAAGLPVYARGTYAHPFGGRLLPWEVDVPIHCGGVLVRPGDWILADRTSVIVIPVSLVTAVVEHDEGARAEESFSQALLQAGFALDEAFPLSERMRPYLDRFRQDGSIPSPNEVGGKSSTC